MELAPKAKVSYFFFSPEKFVFPDFSAKIEWVSKNSVFFFSGLFFFFSGLLKLSEWVRCKLFQEKKKNNYKKKTLWEEKKNPPKILKSWNTTYSLLILRWTFLKIEWVEDKLFQGRKKKQLFFFSSRRQEKKKTNFSKSSEWVGHKLFRGKKKIRYLTVPSPTDLPQFSDFYMIVRMLIRPIFLTLCIRRNFCANLGRWMGLSSRLLFSS